MMQKGGFELVDGLLPETRRDEMLAEAMRLYAEAYASNRPYSDGEEIRGGSPARRFLSSQGGPIQDQFYHDSWLAGFLAERTGTHVAPTGERGTFTYYVRPGDHLAIHRDVQACDVAVISCLHENARPEQIGGCLALYPDRVYEPLSSIRRTQQNGAVRFPARTGATIVLFGGWCRIRFFRQPNRRDCVGALLELPKRIEAKGWLAGGGRAALIVPDI